MLTPISFVALSFLVLLVPIDARAVGRCAYVDVGIFDLAEPKRQCVNLEMTCRADEQYGCFKGPLELKSDWVDGGKAGKLRELGTHFGFIDPDGMHWDVPAGFQTDGASIPLFFRVLIGGPWRESYVKAAVIHDFYIRRKSVSAEAVHKVFYFALRAAGNSQRRAEEMYFAVGNFGPQWKHVDVAAYEEAWRARKSMLERVIKWHKEVWDAFQESERKREAQAAIDREVISRPLPQRTKVFRLPVSGDPLSGLDAFVDDTVGAHIMHPDRDATLIQSLREQVEDELKRPANERDNVFVVQFTTLGATTVRFSVRSDEEQKAQLELVDQLTRAQEQAKDVPFEVCVGECQRARSNQNGVPPSDPGPPRLGP